MARVGLLSLEPAHGLSSEQHITTQHVRGQSSWIKIDTFIIDIGGESNPDREKVKPAHRNGLVGLKTRLLFTHASWET